MFGCFYKGIIWPAVSNHKAEMTRVRLGKRRGLLLGACLVFIRPCTCEDSSTHNASGLSISMEEVVDVGCIVKAKDW